MKRCIPRYVWGLTLNHEILDDPVKGTSLEVSGDAGGRLSGFAGAERAEILGRFGDDVGKEFEQDAAEARTADGHVQENARIGSRHGERLRDFYITVFSWRTIFSNKSLAFFFLNFLILLTTESD